MKVIDIIRKVLDLIDDRESEPQEIDILQTPESEIDFDFDLDYLATLAGLESKSDSDCHGTYNNEPNEQYRSVSNIIATGTDGNKSKHPSDIRTNAPSMFPNFQADNH